MKRFTDKKVRRFLIKNFEIQNKAAGLIIKIKFYLMFLIFIYSFSICYNNFYYNFEFDF